MRTCSGLDNLRRPPALQRGDRIGVIAPSFPAAAWFPDRFERALSALESRLGLAPVVAEQARVATGFTAGTITQRADAINDFLRDRSIRALFCTTGGFNSTDLVPLVDWSALSADPKVMIGYSDVTALLVAGVSVARCVTFYGPTLLPQFGEYPAPLEFSIQWLEEVLFAGAAPLSVVDPPSWTNEFLDWGTDDWQKRARQMTAPAKSVVIHQGNGCGQLFGGNLETLNFLVGTEFFQIPDEMVFFFEVTAEEAYVPRVRRALRHLEQVGVFNRTRAILVGRSPDATPASGVTLHDVVRDIAAPYAIPVIADLPFGHTDPMVTLPIGAHLDVSAAAAEWSIVFADAAVARRGSEPRKPTHAKRSTREF